ncbi:MAG: zinc ribbon domain-containing protein [Chloroflexi bacterium]|nr:zinc ribbon domain-containing protein [Anaerolineaceae bacterium]NMB88152.1 zinc ribbon domain-containing protein [Chloroflexota bacterium]
MPIYEYVCDSCGQQFELMRSIKDANNTAPCKHCHSSETHKMLSVFFAHSDGRSVEGSGHSCANCSGGACSGCGHH